jgi:hypothetical protein
MSWLSWALSAAAGQGQGHHRGMDSSRKERWQMYRLLVGIMAVVLAAVSLSPVASAQGEARIRVLHASPDAPAVDIFLDGQKAITNLAFDSITDYVNVPAGAHNVKVFPAPSDGSGTPVIEADVTLSAGTDYTVAAVGKLSEIGPLVLTDDNKAPAEGQARLRFVHASPDAPAVDIYAEGAGVVVPNAAFKDASGYLDLPAGTYNLEVRAAGTETVALDLPGITLEKGKVYTAFAVGVLQGQPALKAKLTVDASTPHSLPVAGTGPAEESSGSATWLWLAAVGLGLVGLAALAASTRLAAIRLRRR